MSGFGLNYLLDPLVGGDFLSSIIPLLTNTIERRDQSSDPNVLAFLNNRIDDYNTANATNPVTGQRNAGSLFGDPLSGYGGSYGRDRRGNPYGPFQARTRYLQTQLNQSQGNLDQLAGGYQRIADSIGVPGAGGLNLNLGTDQLGLRPDLLLGIDQSQRRTPQAMEHVQAPQDWLSQFLGSFAVGTTSVPRTGLALVHQGEAIVPRVQNPQALPPGVPGAPLDIAAQPQTAQKMPLPAATRGGGTVANLGGPGMMPPAPAAPQAPAGNSLPAAAPTQAPYGVQANFAPLQPGLSPEVQQQIINRGIEGVDQQNIATQRALREQAALGGGNNSGALDRRLFDAELARRADISNLTRDVGLEAANRQFTDTLQANQFDLSRVLGLGGLGLQQGQLALSGELGRGQLANDTLLAQLQQELGRGNLGIAQQAQDLSAELGRGNLGVAQGGLANDTLLAQLQQELGRGNLGIAQQAQNLAAELGRGNLGLGQGQLALGQNQLALDRQLGLGNLNLGQQQLNLDQLLGLGGLDLQRTLGLGGLANESRGLDIQQLLGQGGLANEARGLDIQQLLGQGNLGLGQQQLNLDQLLGQQGIDLQRQLGLGNLDLGQQQLNLDQLLGQGGLDLQRQLGLGGLNLDRDRLALDRLLGQGQLGIQQGQLGLGQQQLNLDRQLGLGNLNLQQGDLSRLLLGDVAGILQTQQQRNDNLSQQDFYEEIQRQALDQQSSQFGDLLALLGQFPGQTASQAPADPLGDFLRGLFGGGN